MLLACLQGLTRTIRSDGLAAHPDALPGSLLRSHLPVRRGPNRASWSSRPGADAGALEQNVARLFRDKVKFSLHVEFTQASILAGGVLAVSGFVACAHFLRDLQLQGSWVPHCLLPVPSEQLLVCQLVVCMPPRLGTCCCFVTQAVHAVPSTDTYT